MSNIRDQYGLNETAVLTLRDGADEIMMGSDKKPCTVTIYGPGTKQHMRALARSQGDSIERMQRKGKLKKSGDDVRRESVEYAADVTKCFSENFIADMFPAVEGKERLEGRDLIVAIYSDEQVGYLLSEQVATFQRDTQNFTRGFTKP